MSFLKNLLKGKDGGTFVGNMLRSYASKVSGGFLGNGAMLAAATAKRAQDALKSQNDKGIPTSTLSTVVNNISDAANEDYSSANANDYDYTQNRETVRDKINGALGGVLDRIKTGEPVIKAGVDVSPDNTTKFALYAALGLAALVLFTNKKY